MLFKKNRNKVGDNYEFFRAIADTLYYSIRNQNEKLAKTIADFMYDAFKQFRDKNQNKEVVYPSIYYEMVHRTIEELAIQKNRRLIFLEHRTAGSVWLLGEFGNSKISETTYGWIWSNFILAIKYERDDYIIYHWEQATQYIQYTLDYIHPIYANETVEITNQEEINTRLTERRRFLEFHYALGGLLLYQRKYSVIQRAFSFTQSIPPRYELLPETMDEVFEWFFDFLDPYHMKHPWLSSTYYFPELSGLNSDQTIKKWICQYIAVLFLRQYTITPYLITMRPLDIPTIPSTQSERRQWIDHLEYFKRLVEETLRNQELLITLRLDFITDEWCEKNNKPKPVEFIETVKQRTIDSFENTLINQEVSQNKVQKFIETTVEIISPRLEEVNAISNKVKLDVEVNKWYINGLSNVIDKSAFAENQDGEHINFHSFLAERFVEKFGNGISETFALTSSQNYLLVREDLASALEKIKFDARIHVVISFGIELSSLSSISTQDEIEFLYFNFGNYRLIGHSLFILKKTDLPEFNYRDFSEEDITKYALFKVLPQYNLYLSIVDLNESIDLRNSLSDFPKDRDLRKSVFEGIFLNLELKWKKNIKCIQLKEASPYRERGIINHLNDVKPFDYEPDN